NSGSGGHHLTSYPRIGAGRLLGPREAIGRETDSADTSAPTNRIAAAPVGRLSRWDVVDTGTLYVIGARDCKEL
ncbi:hypothetical protein, partial [Paenibacillus glucanolyticus]|uniref:hypothetical protein n=1 Tax=Paenibacillus glucanolyticus TaxID=59843 RepID=UPI0034CF3C58